MGSHSVAAGNKPVHHHAHHFDSADAEFEASKQGMWVFLVTEVLMFGGLFVAYFIFRGMYPEAFKEAHKLLQIPMGAINTVVLLTSSLTMVLGVHAAQQGLNKKANLYLAATIACAFGFMVIKYFEYTHKFHEGIFPAGLMTFQGLKTAPEKLFISLYFVMTGLHGLHVVIGIGLIAWIMKRCARNEFGPHFYTPVELVGFYWHFVDLVWIYLFPLLYLIG